MTTEAISALLLVRIAKEEESFDYCWDKNDANGYDQPADSFHEYLNNMSNVELLNMLTDSYI